MNIAAYPTHELTSTTQVAHLPVIPSHWEVRRVKYASNLKSEKIASKGCDLPYIGMENVQSWSGNLLEGGSEVEGLATTFEAGDILFGKLRPYLAKVVKPGFSGICSSEFLVFQSAKDTFGDFLAYALRSSDFISLINGSTYGAKMPRANPDFIANAEIPFPPLPEQRAIAAFLDNKSAKIDQAVRIKEAQIKLLRERRQILIQQAVTRGLNPGAPMKDSGIDWIGEIPAHWKVWRSKFLFKQSKELARKNDIQLSATQSFGVISQEKFESLVGRRVVKISTNLDKRKHVELNDFVISMRSFQGGLERAYSTGCIRSSYVILRPAPEVNPDFFGYLLKTPRYIHALQITGNFIRDGQDLTFENFADVDLYVPPYQEQAEIADHIKHSCDRIDDAIKIKQNQIAKLKEYKTTLINAAVTGKIKVS
ncbi:restriction endonuclease subunit S [Halomonas aquamarina]|uniref:restriction endonuclease subunit S n=1 Tax=Halomonadaceae TaxID=28256 RepID=UPI001BCA8B20|nr:MULTISPECIES: restriction endonuclease subunit S [Halomonas]MCF2914409.1 restriction endonuclease subunit S [Halomonas sp. Cn5-12]MCO7244440.1 restriction endonuclease subunit S [Halomonas sp. Ps84H-12]MDC8442891.1 restriction endonuclease subunit S [Halomonas aquamarina]MDK2750711.1 restriction endonuclease subunit S [Halomonas meridiana]